MKRSSRWISLSLACFGGTLLMSSAYGQALERHTPEVPPGAPHAAIAAPNLVPDDQDDRPIGPTLRAIHLLGTSDAVLSPARDGVSIGAVERLDVPESRNAMAATLAPFLNRPLSRKLIAQIEAAIATRFRDMHYPFVSLSTPEQEIDTGALQIRVIEFKVGKIAVQGVGGEEADQIKDRLGVEPGNAINSGDLSRSLDWINRYPFRQLQAVFSPGEALGSTDLNLQAAQSRPWQAYAGYTNDGSPATGYDRVFLGGAAGGLLLSDSVTAVQLTSSTDPDTRYPRYESAALTFEAPVGPGRIETVFDAVRTFQDADDFTSGNTVVEGSLGYRLPIGWTMLGDGDSDLRFGIEANRQNRTIYFGGTKVYQVGMDAEQVYLGMQTQQDWGTGILTVHISPGGITAANSDPQVYLYSLGRMQRASYVYADFDYSKQVDLGIAQWAAELTGQYSPDVLPFTAQSGLGGMTLVRGYSLENGAFDTAVMLRNELRFDAQSWQAGDLSPYLFLDGGVGRDNYLRNSQEAASAGGGFRVRALDHVTLNALGGVALAHNSDIDPGDGFFRINVTLDY